MTNLVVFIFGASIGSFLNVLIDRLPQNESINGRSHCDFCKKKIPWYDLFPVISFFILGGRTRCCGKKLSWQYPVVELITGISFVTISVIPSEARNLATEGSVNLFSYASLDPSGFALRMTMWGLISCLIVIFVSDLKYHLISDYILLALFVFTFLFHLSNSGAMKQFSNFFLSALIAAFPIFLIYYFSKERAMGLGDVYLSAIMGFLLGWQKGFLALYIAFVTGAVVGVFLMLLLRKKIKSKIAFGPFLVIGTVILLFFGERVITIIRGIYGF